MLKKIITGLIIIGLCVIVVFFMIKSDIINIFTGGTADNEPVSAVPLTPFILDNKTIEQYGELKIERSTVLENLNTDELTISDTEFQNAFTYYRAYSYMTWNLMRTVFNTDSEITYNNTMETIGNRMDELFGRLSTMSGRIQSLTDNPTLAVLYNACTDDYTSLYQAWTECIKRRDYFNSTTEHVIVDNWETITQVEGLKESLADYTMEYYAVLYKINNNTVTDTDMDNLLTKYTNIYGKALVGLYSADNSRTLEYYTNLSSGIENTYSSIKNLYDNKNLLDATVTQKAEHATEEIKETVETNKEIAEAGSQDITQEFETVLGDMQDVSNNPINTFISSNGFIIKMIVIFLAEILVGVVLCRV